MRTIQIMLVLASLFTCACSEDNDLTTSDADYFFHLEEEGAYLPVWLRGNIASNRILLYIQGGPGLNTMDFATVDYAGWENTLERDYAVAYYDQRGTGNAQGDFELETVTLTQYLKDLRKIIAVLKDQYPNAEVYLFGHSFGGWLAYLYALEYQDNPVVAGLVAMNAPFTTDHNEIRWTFRHAFLNRVAKDFLERGEEVAFWQEVLDWTVQQPSIESLEQKRQWNLYVIKGLADYEIEPPLRTGKLLKGVFASSINVFPTLMAQDRLDAVSDRLFEDQRGIELLDRLAEIELPLLLMTGSYDDIAPVEELEFAFDQLGAERKQLEVLPEAGHDAMLNQPELFRQILNAFIP